MDISAVRLTSVRMISPRPQSPCECVCSVACSHSPEEALPGVNGQVPESALVRSRAEAQVESDAFRIAQLNSDRIRIICVLAPVLLIVVLQSARMLVLHAHEDRMHLERTHRAVLKGASPPVDPLPGGRKAAWPSLLSAHSIYSLSHSPQLAVLSAARRFLHFYSLSTTCLL